MATNFRRTKLERFVKRWEARLSMYQQEIDSTSNGPAERHMYQLFHNQLKEFVTDIRHEFELDKMKESEKE